MAKVHPPTVMPQGMCETAPESSPSEIRRYLGVGDIGVPVSHCDLHPKEIMHSCSEQPHTRTLVSN